MTNEHQTDVDDRHWRRNRWRGRMAVIIVAFMAITACTSNAGTDTTSATETSGGSEDPTPTTSDSTDNPESSDDPLRIAVGFSWSTLDPIASPYTPSGFGYGDMLLRQTSSGEPEPWILESIEALSPTEWELRINEGVTFHNGNPCDAEAVAALLNHQIAENAQLSEILSGATAEATGPLTVLLTTTTPVAPIPSILANNELVAVYDVDALLNAGDDAEAQMAAGIFTGPYIPVSLDSTQMVLERNEDYWQGMPPLPGVEVKFISDGQAKLLAVQSGELDVALDIPLEAAGTLEDLPTAEFVTAEVPTSGPRGMFNLNFAPADDPLVRQAVSLAIDYEEIANDVLNGYASVAEGLFPQHLPFAIANQEHDPDAAGARLDDAGWTLTSDGTRSKDGEALQLTIVTYAASDQDALPVAVAIASQLEEVGIGVEIREIESNSVLYSGEVSDWHLAIFKTGFFGYGDVVSNVQSFFVTGGGLNRFGISDPDIDALGAELLETFETEERHELLRRLQEIVIDEQAYVVVTADRPLSAATSPKWVNYEPSLFYYNVDWETAP